MAIFQAELRPARVLRQIVDALKEIVGEVQFECTDSMVIVQAMDSSHVSLVSLRLEADAFQSYRCEKNMTLGVNVGNLSKILKCAGNDDSVMLVSESGGDTLRLRFSDLDEERVSEFAMKLIDIGGDSLGIPQQAYKVCVDMPSSEYARIVKDIANLGDTVTVEVNKSAVTFSASGDIGSARVQLKASRGSPAADVKPAVKKEKEEKVKKESGTESPRAAGKKSVVRDDDDGTPDGKRRKKVQDGVKITCHEPVTLQFALRYLSMFSRAQAISETVSIRLAKDVPLQVEFTIDNPQASDTKDGPLGTLRYYLAPKVGDGEADAPADDAQDE